MKATILVAIALTSGLCFAQERKAATRIDFNNMIDTNNRTREEIQKDLSAKPELQAEHPEKSSVADFVDVEVSIGDDAPKRVVKRTYNSVQE